MKGFAESLLARGRGVAQVVQPLLPSRFEPDRGLGLEIVEEAPAPTAARAAHVTSAREEGPRAQRPQPIRPEEPARAPQALIHTETTVPERLETREIRTERFEREVVRERHTFEPAPVAPAATIAPQNPPRPLVARPEPMVVPHQLLIIEERAAPAPQPSIEIPKTASRAIEPQIVPENRLVTPNLPPAPKTPRLTQQSPVVQVTPAPEVQITIGRIEIRSTPASPPPNRRNAPAGLTLDEYARRRNPGATR